MRFCIKYVTLIVSLVLISSCTIQKRHYFSGYYVGKNSLSLIDKKSTNIVRHDFLKNEKKQVTTTIDLLSENSAFPNASKELTASLKSNPSPITIKSVFIEDCDLIILKNGDEIKGKVTEITLSEIKYKKCDNLSGPTISVSKHEVFMVRYSNGTKDIITPITAQSEKPSNNAQSGTETKVHGLAIASFILSLVAGSVFYYVSIILGIICAILAITFAIVALVKIRKNPNQYKGKGLAIAGLIIGILAFLGSIAILAALSAYL